MAGRIRKSIRYKRARKRIKSWGRYFRARKHYYDQMLCARAECDQLEVLYANLRAKYKEVTSGKGLSG